MITKPKAITIQKNWEKLCLIWIFLSVGLLGFIQPGYNHLRDTVSVLAIGQYGWLQSLNFLCMAAVLWSIGYHFPPAQTKRLYSVKNLFYAIGTALGLLVLFPTYGPDAVVKHFTGWSNPQSFAHFFLVAIVAAILLPALAYQLYTEVRQQPGWQQLTKFLSAGAIAAVIAIPSWLALRITGLGYDYKGLLEKIAMSLAGYLLWQLLSLVKPSTHSKR